MIYLNLNYRHLVMGLFFSFKLTFFQKLSAVTTQQRRNTVNGETTNLAGKQLWGHLEHTEHWLFQTHPGRGYE